MDEIQALGLFVLSEMLHLFPWFLLAIVLGIAAQRFSLDVVARRNFSRHGVLGIAVVTAIGAFSPFCSFTVIPLIRRFLIAGVPLSAVMAFWIASPSMDPEIYALSAAQLGFPVATARLIGALVLSFGAGLVVLVLERRGYFSTPLRTKTASAPAAGCSRSEAPACSSVNTPAPVSVGAGPGEGAGAGPGEGDRTAAGEGTPGPAGGCSSASAAAAEADDPTADDGTPWRVLARRDLEQLKAGEILREIWGDSIALGKWLLLAIVLEAVIIRYVPADLVESLLGVDGIMSVALAGAVSVPLYLNGVGAIPVVHGLLEQGMVPAAAVTFLLGGAVTTIPAMVAVRSVVNNRVFGFYLAVGLGGSIGLGLLLLPVL